MVCIAGWLGIASTRPEFDRLYALIFGLGLGLIGDETGLLLTLGDYHSELTYVAVLVGLSAVAMTYLTFRYAPLIRNDIILIGKGERTIHLGVGVIALSSLPFAFDHDAIGAAALALGLVLTAIGAWLHRRHARN